MAHFSSSIRTRLMLFIVAFVAIVVGVAVSGALSLKSVDVKTKGIDQKSLAGTAMLAEMGDRVAEYRIAEGYSALATDSKARADAEVLADQHRLEIKDLRNEYVALLGSQIQKADLESFSAAWSAYRAEHDAWIGTEVAGAGSDRARYNGSLQRLYDTTDLAIDQLIAANRSGAHAKAVAVDQLADASSPSGLPSPPQPF